MTPTRFRLAERMKPIGVAKWGGRSIWIWLPVLFGCLACSYSPARFHPQFDHYASRFRTVLLLAPEVEAYQQMADGSLMKGAIVSAQASHNISVALQRALTQKNFRVCSLAPLPADREEARNVQRLYRAVNHAIQLHTYGPQLFPSKMHAFEFEVGAVTRLLADARADALALVIAHQTRSANRPRTWLSIALVEPQGRVVWYGMQGAKDELGIEGAEAARRLVDLTLQALPGRPS